MATVAGPVSPTAGAVVSLRPLGVDRVRITGGFWADRLAANAAVSIPEGWERLHAAGNVRNLQRAAARGAGDAEGEVFADSDVHKWLEAAAWEIGRTGDQGLLARQRELTAIVAAAQQPDGYLDSVPQLRGMPRYAELGWSHELYCAGHLIQAAVAQRRATGDTALLEVAVRLADHLVTEFGPGGSHALDGHPVIETALVELHRETGTAAYLDLARWYVDARGRGTVHAYGRDAAYFSDRIPVREATSPEGHAVRAVYLAAGAADVAVEDRDAGLLERLGDQFTAMAATKQYVTGGLGARWDGEAFGDPFELPSDRAYAESCAAIGGVQWAQRMLLATGDERYADQVERMLLNGVLPGVALTGGEYFYVNALQVRGDAVPDDERNPANGRRGWFGTACCPPNIMRTLSSLASLVATGDDDGVQLHQYATCRVEGAGLVLDVETGLPFDGRVAVRVREAPERDVALSLRVPGWAAAGARLDGRPVGPGLATVRRRFRPGEAIELVLPMEPRLVAADPRVDAVRGEVAVLVGPLVMAVEQVDQDAPVDDLHLDAASGMRAAGVDEALGVPRLALTGHVHPREPGDDPWRPRTDPGRRAATVVAVPYLAWANRGPGAMRVWLPLD